VFQEACTNIAIKTLFLALLTTQMMIRRRPIRTRANTTKSRTVPLGGISVASWEGIKNPGKCHRAHRLPRIRPPIKGPHNRCKRGCAKPVQPGSSKSWSSYENHGDECTQIVQKESLGGNVERLRSTGPDESGKHHGYWEPNESEHVPSNPNAPAHHSAEQARCAGPPFGNAVMMNPDKIGPSRPAIANERTASSLRLITP
jgi:hypothetical protein